MFSGEILFAIQLIAFAKYPFSLYWNISVMVLKKKPQMCGTICTIKQMKGKAPRKHSLHEETAASVLLKLFISGKPQITLTLHLKQALMNSRTKFLIITYYIGSLLNAVFKKHKTGLEKYSHAIRVQQIQQISI